MRIDVVTIFPEYLSPLRESLLGRAIADGVISLKVHDLRDWTFDRHRSVDDTPYGGGPGMVMRPDVWGRALDDILDGTSTLVVPTPAGERFGQPVAVELAAAEHLVFACGRYEGVDQRVVDDARRRVTVRELSIGDFVLAGGEAATLVIVEAVGRLLPGVLGNPASTGDDSFGSDLPGLVEAPSYTRPPTYRDLQVPSVLLSGDHAAIRRWRRSASLQRTAMNRPDLLGALDATTMDGVDLDALVAVGATPPDGLAERIEAERALAAARKAGRRRAGNPPGSGTMDRLSGAGDPVTDGNPQHH
jgi:tRNA (guanine37-N1)-methyltransferase